MFESSLIASQQRHVSSGERWTAFASITLQATIVASLVALPLLHPERLAFHLDATHPNLPLLKMPKLLIVKTQQAAAAAASAKVPRMENFFTAPPQIPAHIDTSADTSPAPADIGLGSGMSNGAANPLAVLATSTAPRVVVAAAHTPAKTVHVSTGVMDGLLLSPIRPVYPAIAKAVHVEGTVVVEAIISKAGTIESLHVLSGPPMLQRAAIEAIQAARYTPYRLNGEPTEVQTQITVNFRFSS